MRDKQSLKKRKDSIPLLLTVLADVLKSESEAPEVTGTLGQGEEALNFNSHI
jgi:hypothetical protein